MPARRRPPAPAAAQLPLIPDRTPTGFYRVTLVRGTFYHALLLYVEDGQIGAAAPSAERFVGERASGVLAFYADQGWRVERLSE